MQVQLPGINTSPRRAHAMKRRGQPLLSDGGSAAGFNRRKPPLAPIASPPFHKICTPSPMVKKDACSQRRVQKSGMAGGLSISFSPPLCCLLAAARIAPRSLPCSPQPNRAAEIAPAKSCDETETQPHTFGCDDSNASCSLRVRGRSDSVSYICTTRAARAAAAQAATAGATRANGGGAADSGSA